MEGRYGHSTEAKASLILFGYLTFFFCLRDDVALGKEGGFLSGYLAVARLFVSLRAIWGAWAAASES